MAGLAGLQSHETTSNVLRLECVTEVLELLCLPPARFLPIIICKSVAEILVQEALLAPLPVVPCLPCEGFCTFFLCVLPAVLYLSHRFILLDPLCVTEASPPGKKQVLSNGVLYCNNVHLALLVLAAAPTNFLGLQGTGTGNDGKGFGLGRTLEAKGIL